MDAAVSVVTCGAGRATGETYTLILAVEDDWVVRWLSMGPLLCARLAVDVGCFGTAGLLLPALTSAYTTTAPANTTKNNMPPPDPEPLLTGAGSGAAGVVASGNPKACIVA